MLPFGNDEPITASMQNSFIGAFLQFSNGAPFYSIDLSNTKKIVNKLNFTIGNLDKRSIIPLSNPITPEAIQGLKNNGVI